MLYCRGRTAATCVGGGDGGVDGGFVAACLTTAGRIALAGAVFTGGLDLAVSPLQTVVPGGSVWPVSLKKQKLTTGYLLIILNFRNCYGRGVFTLGTLTKTIYDHPLVVSNTSLHAALSLTKMHRSMKDLVLANAPAEMEAVLNAVDENERNIYQYLDTIRQDILGEEGKALEKQTRKLFSSWKPIREEVVRLLKSNDQTKAIHTTKAKGADHVAMLELKMLELTAYARKKATLFLNLAEAIQSSLENVTVILTVAGVLLSLVIVFIATYFSHGICPDCMQEHYPAEYAAIKSGNKNKK